MRGSLFRILQRRVIAVAIAAIVVASACSSDSLASGPAPAGPSADVEANDDAGSDSSSVERASAAEGSDEGAVAEEAEERMTMATLVPSLPGPHVAIVVDDRTCDGSPCPTVFELQADGQWSLLAADGTEQAGGFDSQELITLAETLQVDDVVLGPFTGQCPTESGGSERFYRVFSGDTGVGDEPVLDVSTCSHRIDADAQIIVALDLLLAEVLSS